METVQIQDLVVGTTERTVAAIRKLADSGDALAMALSGDKYGLTHKHSVGRSVAEVATALEGIGDSLGKIAAATNKARLQATKDNRASITANARNRRFDTTTTTLRRLALAKRG